MTNALIYDDVVLAAGGRYDALVASFRNAIVSPENQFNQNVLTVLCRKKTKFYIRQYVVGGAIYVINLVKVLYSYYIL